MSVFRIGVDKICMMATQASAGLFGRDLWSQMSPHHWAFCFQTCFDGNDRKWWNSSPSLRLFPGVTMTLCGKKWLFLVWICAKGDMFLIQARRNNKKTRFCKILLEQKREDRNFTYGLLAKSISHWAPLLIYQFLQIYPRFRWSVEASKGYNLCTNETSHVWRH